MIELLVILPSFISELQHAPLPPKWCGCFHSRLTFESIEELGCASKVVRCQGYLIYNQIWLNIP
jgi:hypothetical protein